MFVETKNNIKLEDCVFYHTMDIPGHGHVEGEWDLRGKEKQYLGDFDFSNKSVIEIGPSTGAITVYLSKSCSSLVSFEVSEDCDFDLLPYRRITDMKSEIEHSRIISKNIKNAWMLVQKAFQTKAKAYYGNIYSIPENIGKYDVAVFASVLLHLRDPFKALEQIYTKIDESIIITDM